MDKVNAIHHVYRRTTIVSDSAIGGILQFLGTKCGYLFCRSIDNC